MSERKMDLVAVFKEAWATAEEKGWHEFERPAPEFIALLHSEVSEALEAYRHTPHLAYRWDGDSGKPEGFLVELADVLIRLGDFLESHELTEAFVSAVIDKLDFNSTRPYRHGAKVC